MEDVDTLQTPLVEVISGIDEKETYGEDKDSLQTPVDVVSGTNDKEIFGHGEDILQTPADVGFGVGG